MANGLFVVSDAEELGRHPGDLDHGPLIQVVDLELGYGRVVGTVCRGLLPPLGTGPDNAPLRAKRTSSRRLLASDMVNDCRLSGHEWTRAHRRL
jgi:hypothetical protein